MARVITIALLAACTTGDYDPLSPPADAQRMTLEIEEGGCDKWRPVEYFTGELELYGIRVYTPVECHSCLDSCAACSCPRYRKFVIRIEPEQVSGAELRGWTLSPEPADGTCESLASLFECSY